MNFYAEHSVSQQSAFTNHISDHIHSSFERIALYSHVLSFGTYSFHPVWTWFFSSFCNSEVIYFFVQYPQNLSVPLIYIGRFVLQPDNVPYFLTSVYSVCFTLLQWQRPCSSVVPPKALELCFIPEFRWFFCCIPTTSVVSLMIPNSL